jgi:DNA processing protein
MKSLFQTKPRNIPDTVEKLDWLRLIRTENIGPITFYRLLEQYGTATKALEALPEMAKRGGRAKPLYAPSRTEVEKEYNRLQKMGGDIITVVDENYPLALAAIDDAPPVLAVLGDAAYLKRQNIAIVGARNASMNGRKFASKLARDLGAAGQVVTSGFARGIDTAAHEGALATGTIAVMAGGIDVIYPEENKSLYEQIKEQGIIIAESPLGTAPKPQHFPRRNRIVSGMSSGIIVVEANLKSGSLITARMAGEQGRDVFAVPGHPYDPRASGPNALIRDGAILVRNAQDILDHINAFKSGFFGEGPQPVPDFIQPIRNPETISEDIRQSIIENLSYSATPVDEIIRTCQLNIGVVQVVLLELELAGRLKRLLGNAVSLLEAE